MKRLGCLMIMFGGAMLSETDAGAILGAAIIVMFTVGGALAAEGSK